MLLMPYQGQLARQERISNHRQLLIKGSVHLIKLLVSLFCGSPLGNDLQSHLILLLKNQLILSLNVLGLSLG